MSGWKPCRTSPPGTSSDPVSARNAQCRRMAEVELRCWSVIGVHGMTLGVFVANMRAAAAIRSGGQPVIAATRSRGNSATRARKASKPTVQRSAKSRS